ncbi:MAG: hypothetical protein ACRDJH_08425 [Thermomicrobiales bacterium]
MISRPMALTRRGLVSAALQATAITALTPLAIRGQEATPESKQREASPVASPQATPAAGAVGGLAEMLALAPDVLAQPDHPLHLAQFGDVAAQLAAVGKKQPTSTEDPAMDGWIPSIQWITLPQSVTTRGIQPEFRELFGFDLFQVDQGLMLGEPPNLLTYVRGRFDENELRAAWTGAGYRELDVDGIAVFSLAEGPEMDMDNPVNQMVLAQFNNATILADGALVFASSLDLIRGVLAVATGQASSLAENDQVAALLSTVDQPLAAALLMDGESLAGGMIFDPRMTPEQIEQLQEDVAQSGEMPPAKLALFGVTPGGPISAPPDQPDATPVAADNPAIWVIRLLMASAASAETAAVTIPNRIATLNSLVRHQPYADMVTVRRSEALADPPAVALDLEFNVDEVLPALWYQAIVNRDVLFLAS